MRIEYTEEELKLANEIAGTLDDWDGLPLFRKYAHTYQESFLRKKLAKVMTIPEKNIRKNRAALFTFLVSQPEKHGSRA